jgi:hypothetical protein
MELTLGKLVGIGLTLAVLALLLGLRYLLPYKSAFMRWYMKTFSAEYKAMKVVFDEMVSMQEHYAGKYSESETANLHFLLHLYADKRFISNNDKERVLYGAKSSEYFYRLNTCSISSLEMFTCCSKAGKKSHRVKILFILKNGTVLRSIELMYIEENGPDTFAYFIETKKFPPNHRGGGGKMHSPEPDPVLVDSM